MGCEKRAARILTQLRGTTRAFRAAGNVELGKKRVSEYLQTCRGRAAIGRSSSSSTGLQAVPLSRIDANDSGRSQRPSLTAHSHFQFLIGGQGLMKFDPH